MKYIGYIAVMAVTTYLIRMIPLTVFSKEIKSNFIRSFLYYIPFTVLGAMTFPSILFSTASAFSAAVGLAVAVFIAYKGKGLLTVAISACCTVFAVELIMRLIKI